MTVRLKARARGIVAKASPAISPVPGGPIRRPRRQTSAMVPRVKRSDGRRAAPSESPSTLREKATAAK